jgi:hypothetical protein
MRCPRINSATMEPPSYNAVLAAFAGSMIAASIPRRAG